MYKKRTIGSKSIAKCKNVNEYILEHVFIEKHYNANTTGSLFEIFQIHKSLRNHLTSKHYRIYTIDLIIQVSVKTPSKHAKDK